MARPTPEQAALVPFPPYRAKRVLDLALLVVVAIPATCVGAVCAVAVRLTSPARDGVWRTPLSKVQVMPSLRPSKWQVEQEIPPTPIARSVVLKNSERPFLICAPSGLSAARGWCRRRNRR